MKTARSMTVVAALAAMSSFSVLAQPAAAPTRSEVQKEAVAAGKAGQTVTGECSPDQKADAGACAKKPATATKSRDEVKKEAAAANKAGKIEHGEADHMNKEDKGKSVKSREEVKKEAAAATKYDKTSAGAPK